MTGALLRKTLRDIRLPLLVLIVLLIAFQCLWAQVVKRIIGQLLPELVRISAVSGIKPHEIEQTIFEGPGKLIKTMIGGDNISLFSVRDMLTVSYMHTVVLTILCLWAVGRASGAITGEIDRGTMELLLAQPLARYRILVTHFLVDCITIPLLCLALWAGNWAGIWLVGVTEDPTQAGSPLIDAAIFGPALWNVGMLVFAMSGYTIWLSAGGRFRWRVLGLAVLITLLQYLLNVIGQLWDLLAPFRPLTVFYYYQPQQIILRHRWTADWYSLWNSGHVLGSVNVVVVLLVVGLAGYILALWTFCRRDLPAPL
jgi:ABC-2 type transport system permease protein